MTANAIRPTKARSVWRIAHRTPTYAADPRLPTDTRLWAALQRVSGGTWGGCVYDVDRIIELLEAGEAALAAQAPS